MQRSIIIAAIVAAASTSPLQSQEGEFNQTASPTELLEVGMQNDVGSDGAYRYQIPFELPEFKGLEPNLGLKYNSAQKLYSTSGPIVGVGWEVSGLSTIERQSIGGGVASFVPGEDVFVLDGQVLLACSNTGSTAPYQGGSSGLPVYPERFETTNASASCSTGGQLVTLMDDGRRIQTTSVNRDGIAVPQFTVTQQDGTQHIYVSSGQARSNSSQSGLTNADAKARFWGTRFVLSEIRDAQPSPNRILFSYQGADGPEQGSSAKDTGVRLTKISYAGYEVRFNYRSASRVLRSTATGSSLLTNTESKYLSSVEVRDGSNKIRAYNLAYSDSTRFGTKLLVSTQQFGRDYLIASNQQVADGTSLPKTTFKYNSDTFYYSTTATLTLPDSETSPHAPRAYVGDFNADGRDDIVFGPRRTEVSNEPSLQQRRVDRTIHSFSGSKQPIVLNETFSLFRAWYTSNSSDGTRTAAGTDSVLPFSEARGLGHLSTIRSVGRQGTELTRQNYNQNGSAANSSGQSYRISEGSSHIEYSPNLDRDPELEVIIKAGRSGDAPHKSFDRNAQGYANANFDFSGARFYASDDRGAIIGDFDGNGLSDIAAGDRTVLNYESGFRHVPTALPDIDVKYLGFAADMNRDGLDDIVRIAERDSRPRAVAIYYSNGQGFGASTSTTLPSGLPDDGWAKPEKYRASSRVSMTDVNGDAYPDLLLTAQDGDTYVLLWDGKGFDFPRDSSGTSTASHPRVAAVGDFDGDGTRDLLRYYGDKHRVAFGTGGAPNLMTEIQTPMGLKIEIGYSASTNSSIVSDDEIPGIRHLVESVVTSDEWNPYAKTSYFYSNSRYDYVWQRSLGFGRVIQVLPKIPSETTHVSVTRKYENSDFRTAGRLISEVRAEGTTFPYNSRVLHERKNNWVAVGEVPQNPVFDPPLSLAAYVTTPSGGTEIASGGPFRSELTSSYERTAYGNNYVATGKTFLTDSFGRQHEVTDLGALNWNSNGSTFSDPTASDNVSVRKNYTSNVDKFILSLPHSISTYEEGSLTSNSGNWLYRTIFDYDGQPYQTPPTNGNATRVRRMQWDGVPQASSHSWINEQRNTYDNKGNLLTTTDPEGNVSTFTYTRNFPASTTNALGHRSTTTWDYRCQRPMVETDANGQKTTHTYDALCRIATTTNPLGSVTRFGHYQIGSKWQARTVTVDTATGGEYRTFHNLDGFGRVHQTWEDGISSDTATRLYHRVRYDARGRVIARSRPMIRAEFDATIAQWQSSGIPSQYASRMKYDNLNRLIETIHVDGSKETIEYTANQRGVRYALYGAENGVSVNYPATTYKDAHCYDTGSEQTVCGMVRHTRNTAGQVFEEFRWDGQGSDSGSSAGARTKNYYYNELGHLMEVRDEKNLAWTYTYDTAGRRLTASDPGLGDWTMEYDLNGNLERQTDAKGQVITWTYDELDRVKTKNVPGEDQIKYYYDAPKFGFHNIGHLTFVYKGFQHFIYYDYNALGLPVSERHHVDTGWSQPADYVFETEYYANGAVKNVRMPLTDGAQPTSLGPFDYDKAGRVESFGNYITGVEYNHWHNPTRTVYGNGVSDERAYDPDRGWLNSIHLYDNNGGQMSVPILYERTGTGRVARRYDSTTYGGGSNGEWETYTYDYKGQLKSAVDGNTSLSYQYDSAGRMTYNSDLGTYTYPYGTTADHAHAPNQVGSETFTYDANGNMLTGLFGKVMTYDAENRPKSVTFNGIKTEYVYGADGSRLKMIENVDTSQEAETLYVGQIEVRDYDTPNATVFAYPHPDVRLVDGEVSHLHRDQLNSVARVSVKWGNQGRIATFHPFGEPEYDYQNRGIGYPDAHGFIGERYDGDAGLQYLNARYYDPKLGLFLQPDWFEVTEPGVGTNRYAYSANDPINNLDPNGNEFFGIPGYYDEAIVGTTGILGVGLAMTLGQPGFFVDLPEIQTRPPEFNDMGLSTPELGSLENQGLTPGSLNDFGQTVTLPSASSDGVLTTPIGDGLELPLVLESRRNILKPDPNATGTHTTPKYDSNGVMTGYQEWIPNSRNPSGFDAGRRVDLTGRAHTNKDGTVVPTPHVHEPGTRDVRPARPDELP